MLFRSEESQQKDIEYYQNLLSDIREQALLTEARLKEIDIRGSFEADDEVGFAFKEIKKLNEDLLQFIIDLDKQESDATESESK